MLTISEKKQKAANLYLNSQKNYNDVVIYLDSKKSYDYSPASIERTKKLDLLLGNVSESLDVILVGGTNGKSSTIHFACKLINEEGFRIGASFSTHFLNYNERIRLSFENISNKDFTASVNRVIEVAEKNGIDATSYEIIIMASFIYFSKKNVDVVLLEVALGGKYDAANICKPKIAVITRVANDHKNILGDDLDKISFDLIDIAKSGSWFISAEQSKIRLQKMKEFLQDRGVKWAMPIRKLAKLPYLYEQLYGRTVSLGERIAQIYVEQIREKFSPFLRENLLATKKGQRGRPTLKEKRNSELNPVKTLKEFWRDKFSLMKGRFECLDKETPAILLDTAQNVDAFENLFLGIRLLHYKKTIKGLSLITGITKEIDSLEALKSIRYLLKKVSGHVFFVPMISDQPYHDPQTLVEMTREMGFSAKALPSFSSAFELAKGFVDERDGLIAIFGSNNMVSEYWKYREIKRL